MTGPVARVLARIRDVPACCICPWEYDETTRRYVHRAKRPGCPWHGAR